MHSDFAPTMQRDEYVNGLVLELYSLGIRGMGRCLHVLDVFRKGLLLKPKLGIPVPEAGEEKIIRSPSDKIIIRSATELREAGIAFDKSMTYSLDDTIESKFLNDISFDHKAVLKLPVLLVDDTTESKFLNAMTFERLHIGIEAEVTSYVAFMDNIINNEQDVALLHTKGIIQNGIGSNEAVAKLFNSLCEEVPLASTSTLKDVQKKMSDYCENDWNEWRAALNHTYFTNPWSSCSLVAAIFLFVLSIISTVYAVLSYY